MLRRKDFGFYIKLYHVWFFVFFSNWSSNLRESKNYKWISVSLQVTSQDMKISLAFHKIYFNQSYFLFNSFIFSYGNNQYLTDISTKRPSSTMMTHFFHRAWNGADTQQGSINVWSQGKCILALCFGSYLQYYLK